MTPARFHCRRSAWLPTLVWLGALHPACHLWGDSGTVVGNPGDSLVSTASSEGITWTRGSAEGITIELFPCPDGSTVEVFGLAETDDDQEFDVLGQQAIALPGGEWCEAFAELDVVELEGSLVSGDTLEVVLEGVEVDLAAASDASGLTIDGQQLILELAYPDWLADIALPPADAGVVRFDSGTAHYDTTLDRLFDGSALFEDADDDGTISDNERSTGAVLAGAGSPSAADEDASDDGEGSGEDSDDDSAEGSSRGCGNSEYVLEEEAAVVFLGLPLLGLRRRRG